MNPTDDTGAAPIELALVIPVYNEAACIRQVIESWQSTIGRLAISCRMIVVDDGSTDGTDALLDQLSRGSDVTVVHQKNAGHGPALLAGYGRAISAARWVFQSDSDEEMNPEDFETLWREREQFDAAFGVRVRTKGNFFRRIITQAAHYAVRLLFGDSVEDPNVPFRLLRSDVLAAILPVVPTAAFAPNLMICGAVAQWQLRIENYPLRNRQRQTGISARREFAVVLGAATAAWQLVAFAMRIRSRPRPANLVRTLDSAPSRAGS